MTSVLKVGDLVWEFDTHRYMLMVVDLMTNSAVTMMVVWADPNGRCASHDWVGRICTLPRQKIYEKVAMVPNGG
jgi:hypothetical protein